MRRNVLLGLIFLGGLAAAQTGPETRRKIDLAPFGQLLTEAGARVGVEWREERDVHEVRVSFAGSPVRGSKIEYWFRTWPYPRPGSRMADASIEDPVDDIYQGRWLPAEVQEMCEGSQCRYTFQPLRVQENSLAANLPGVTYRRTLKVRVVNEKPLPPIAGLQVFSDSLEKPVSIRIALDRWSGPVEVSNGILKNVRPFARGAIVDLVAADPQLAGSLDSTIVTVQRTFSFEVDDLKLGPIHVPDFHAYITYASDPPDFRPPAGKGPRIRQMVAKEPEQTYERASREIPALDPWERQDGGKVYLPLAADSSWQKFAIEYGGNVFISKRGTKAKGQELARLGWSGDRILWKLGTGEKPYFREDRAVKVSKLDGYLPVVLQEWSNEGLKYNQEAFATVLRGPLSPRDPARSEQTPAILMMRMTARNEGTTPRTAHFWVIVEPNEEMRVDGRQLRAAAGSLRAVIEAPGTLKAAAGPRWRREVDRGTRVVPGPRGRLPILPCEAALCNRPQRG